MSFDVNSLAFWLANSDDGPDYDDTGEDYCRACAEKLADQNPGSKVDGGWGTSDSVEEPDECISCAECGTELSDPPDQSELERVREELGERIARIAESPLRGVLRAERDAIKARLRHLQRPDAEGER